MLQITCQLTIVFAYKILMYLSQQYKNPVRLFTVLEYGVLRNGTRYIVLTIMHYIIHIVLQCEAPACYKQGKRYRNVYCYYEERIARFYPDIKCESLSKPPTEQPCYKTRGCPPMWVVTFGPVSQLQLRTFFTSHQFTVQCHMCENRNFKMYTWRQSC